MVLCLSIGRKRIRIMNEENSRGGPAALATRHLCTVEFEVGGGIIGIGASPFGDQRLGYISGGRFFGPRINGIVLPGGGNWSRGGRLGEASSVGTFDARAGWRTDDGDLVYLRSQGRSLLPDADRQSDLWGKRVLVRVDLGGRWIHKKKNK